MLSHSKLRNKRENVLDDRVDVKIYTRCLFCVRGKFEYFTIGRNLSNFLTARVPTPSLLTLTQRLAAQFILNRSTPQ